MIYPRSAETGRRKRGVEHTVEYGPHMQTIQVVLDKKLLHAAD
jgi:hypothetical protein